MMLVHCCQFYYRVILNDCPIAIGVENPYKFWMCRQLCNVRQTNRDNANRVIDIFFF
jgi:hypothetical protein